MATEMGREVVVGSTTTAALIRAAETLLDKRGGYLSNDIMPPGLWLDNIPNWEYGVLIQVRDLSKAMRETLSRSQSQSREDPDLSRAEPHFNFDHSSWMLPSSESEYRAGIRLLAETTGIFTETAGGVTTATLAKLAEAGELGADDRVVVVITGEGLKTLDAVREGFEMHEIQPSLDSFAEVVEDRSAVAV